MNLREEHYISYKSHEEWLFVISETPKLMEDVVCQMRKYIRQFLFHLLPNLQCLCEDLIGQSKNPLWTNWNLKYSTLNAPTIVLKKTRVATEHLFHLFASMEIIAYLCIEVIPQLSGLHASSDKDDDEKWIPKYSSIKYSLYLIINDLEIVCRRLYAILFSLDEIKQT